jgi:hypothetical protein
LFKLRFVDESPKQPPHPLLLLASSTALFTARPILAAPFAVHFAAPSTLYRRLAATFGDRQRARSSLTTRQLLRLLNASKLRQQLLLKLPPTPQHQPFSSFPSLPSNNMNDDNNYRRRFENVHHAFRLQDLRNPQRLRCSTGHYNMPRSSDTAHLVSGSRIHHKASAPGNYDLLLLNFDVVENFSKGALVDISYKLECCSNSDQHRSTNPFIFIFILFLFFPSPLFPQTT